jgi:large subunit ribosomal protein L13e
MVKHNNVIPNQHFRKDWARYVRTWFNQPAKKEARRAHRAAKAKKIAPRPLETLKPAVRGMSIRYNRKVRLGRGFTLLELKEAKINAKEAQGLGIAVDRRRRNKSEEGFKKNVQRLKLYKSKLVVFPRNAHSKKAKKGDSTKQQLAQAGEQVLGTVLPVHTPVVKQKARKIAPKEREGKPVTAILRKALTDSKLWGMREKRKKEKEASAKAPKGEEENADE